MLAASPTHDWVMAASPSRFVTHDRPTNAHETMHLLIGSTGGFDGRQVVALADPGLPTDYVAAFAKARGYRWETYFPTAAARGHRTAFWIVGEASAYLAGAKTAEEDANAGTAVPPSDWVSGVAEFGVYLDAYDAAYRAAQPAAHAADGAWRAFLANWKAEAARVFQANAARWPQPDQLNLFRAWAK